MMADNELPSATVGSNASSSQEKAD